MTELTECRHDGESMISLMEEHGYSEEDMLLCKLCQKEEIERLRDEIKVLHEHYDPVVDAARLVAQSTDDLARGWVIYSLRRTLEDCDAIANGECPECGYEHNAGTPGCATCNQIGRTTDG